MSWRRCEAVCRLFRVLVITAALAQSGCSSEHEAGSPDNTIAGSVLEGAVVVHVKDGDSLVVRHKGSEIEVRLYGIDAPEKRQPYAGESKDAAHRLLDKQSVVLVVKDRDRYDRVVAEAYVAGDPVSINQQLVAEGAAWVYERYTRDPGLLEAQKRARQQRLGIWQLPEAERDAPWVWRKNNTKQRN